MQHHQPIDARRRIYIDGTLLVVVHGYQPLKRAQRSVTTPRRSSHEHDATAARHASTSPPVSTPALQSITRTHDAWHATARSFTAVTTREQSSSTLENDTHPDMTNNSNTLFMFAP